MNIGKIDNAQSFQALNFKNVSTADRKFIIKDFKELQKLGKKYNIRLTSTYAEVFGFNVIDIDVKPLSKDLSLWKKLFPPIERRTYEADGTSTGDTFLERVYEAIECLKLRMVKKG